VNFDHRVNLEEIQFAEKRLRVANEADCLIISALIMRNISPSCLTMARAAPDRKNELAVSALFSVAADSARHTGRRNVRIIAGGTDGRRIDAIVPLACGHGT